MAQIKADSQGFLIGEAMDISRMADHLRRIKDDVAAIRRGIVPATAAQNRNDATRQSNVVAMPHSRDASGRFTSSSPQEAQRVAQITKQAATVTAKAVAEAIARPKVTKAIADAAAQPKSSITRKVLAKVVEPKGRDSKGRFTAGGSHGADGASESSPGLVLGVAGRLVAAVQESAVGADGVDPTVKAAQEIAEPLRRGYSVLFGGGDDKQTRWLKKIFSTLNVFKKDESLYNKASTKVLKGIEEKTGIGGDGGGGFSGGAAGSLLGRFLPWLFGGLAAAGSAVAGGIGSVLTPILATIFSPVGAAIAAAGVVAWGAFTEDGRKFFGDIGGKIASGWDLAVTSFKETFPGVTKAFEESAASISNLFEPIIAFLKDKFGIVGAAAQKTVDVVKEQAQVSGDYLAKSSPRTMEVFRNVKDKAGDAWEGAKAVGGKALESFKNAIPGLSGEQAAAYAADVKRTESSGNYKAENRLGYIGAYQFGADALADSGLVDLAKLKAAKKRGGYSQKAFLSDPSNWNIEGGKEAFLNDSAMQNKAFADMQSRNLAIGVKSGALSEDATPEQIASYLKASHLVGAGGANDLFVRGIDRKDANGMAASKYAAQGAAVIRSIAPVVESAQVATIKAPALPVMPQPHRIAEAPEVQIPLNSTPDRPITVSLPPQDVGRDLSDRGIAHIATGGISRNW